MKYEKQYYRRSGGKATYLKKSQVELRVRLSVGGQVGTQQKICHLSQDLKKVRVLYVPISVGKAFRAEGTVRAKRLRQACPCSRYSRKVSVSVWVHVSGRGLCMSLSSLWLPLWFISVSPTPGYPLDATGDFQKIPMTGPLGLLLRGLGYRVQWPYSGRAPR